MTPIHPEEALQAGAAILDSFLANHEFLFQLQAVGNGSGGRFASGAFVRGNRRLELHFRNSLGLVAYHLGGRSLSHEAFMWAMQGKRHASRYPGFADDPMEEFRGLLADLEENGADFLDGTDAEFLRHMERAIQLERAQPKLPA